MCYKCIDEINKALLIEEEVKKLQEESKGIKLTFIEWNADNLFKVVEDEEEAVIDSNNKSSSPRRVSRSD
jgi:hypothetical protein